MKGKRGIKEGKNEEITSPGYSIDPDEGMPILVSVLIQVISGNPAALVWLLRCPGPGGTAWAWEGLRGGDTFLWTGFLLFMYISHQVQSVLSGLSGNASEYFGGLWSQSHSILHAST